MPVSLRIPETVKRRVEKRGQGHSKPPRTRSCSKRSKKLACEEARAAFHAEAERRLAKVKRSGTGIPAEEAFAYLLARASGRKPARPKARKIA